MTITIHGVPNSSYVRTARMACIEKGLAHTLEAPIEGLHPWKRVPVLRHGDVTLYETSAILRYVEEIGTGPSLLPATAAARGLMEQWISAINCYLYETLVRGYAFSYIGPMLAGKDPDPAQIRASLPALDRDIGRLDAAYAKHAFIAGDAPSLADLLVAPIIQTVRMFPEGKRAVSAAGNLSRAYTALAARPSFGTVHAGMPGAPPA